MRAKRAACVVLVLAVLSSGSAHAEPQANAAVTAGLAGRGDASELWQDSRFHLGARGDVLFGRTGNEDFGWGPFAEGMTSWDDVAIGGGVSALLPVHTYLPVVVSAGAYGWNGPQGGWEPGVSGQLFWGSRSYNYHGSYVMAGGVSLQGRWGLGDSEERTIIVAAHLDGQVLALPFLFLYQAVAGPEAE